MTFMKNQLSGLLAMCSVLLSPQISVAIHSDEDHKLNQYAFYSNSACIIAANGTTKNSGSSTKHGTK